MAAPNRDAELEELRRQLAEQQQLTAAVLTQAAVVAQAVTSRPGKTTRTPRAQSKPRTPSNRQPDEDADRRYAEMLQQQEAGLAMASITPGDDADARYAAALQQMEIADANTGVAVDTRDTNTGILNDPVWGELHIGKDPKPHVILTASCCPCFIRPCCNASRRKAYKRIGTSVTCLLIATQIAVLGALCALTGLAPNGVNPMIGPWPQALEAAGSISSAQIVTNYQLWRLFTPMFLHAGWIHFLSNFVVALRLGLMVEIQWGKLPFSVIYVASVLCASTFSAVVMPQNIGVGASGALMGVLGAWLTYIIVRWNVPDSVGASITPRNDAAAAAAGAGAGAAGAGRGAGAGSRGAAQAVSPRSADTTKEQRPFQLVLAVINIAVVLAFSFTPYIDWAAHLFGLLSGCLLGLVLFGIRLPTRILGIVLWITLVVAGLAVLYGVPRQDLALLDYCGLVRSQYGADLPCPW